MKETLLKLLRDKASSRLGKLHKAAVDAGRTEAADGWAETMNLIHGEESEMSVSRIEQWLNQCMEADHFDGADALADALRFLEIEAEIDGWDEETIRVRIAAEKFPWIFTENMGSKPIDPVLRTLDDFTADDWDWDTGLPIRTSLEVAFGHSITEEELLASAEYYNKFNDGDKDRKAPLFSAQIFEAGELSYDDEGNLTLPVKVLGYPEGFDEMIGRSWISEDSHVSMSVAEAREAGMRHTETVTDAKELTFILSPSYKWADMSPVKLTFYFRKENTMFKKTEYFRLTREVPRKQGEEPVREGLLSAVQKAVDDSASCAPVVPDKEFTAEQIAHAEKGVPEVPAVMPDDAQWFLPVPGQTILDFRVVELKGDYWLFWHDDSHANDGMLPGFDEPNFKAKVYLLLEIEHYADPVAKSYWSCGMRSPYKVPKEAIDRHFISLRYRWMTDPNEHNIMSGHWGEMTLTTDGAGTFEQLAEEVSEEYIQAQSIEQFNQIRGVPGTLTHAPSQPTNELDDEQLTEEKAHNDLMARLLEEGPESWVVKSVDDLPDWYWKLDEFDMNTGSQWGKIQIAPGHYAYYDGSGPRGRWNVPAMTEDDEQPAKEEAPKRPSKELTLEDVLPKELQDDPEAAFDAGKLVGACEADPLAINPKDAAKRGNEDILGELLSVKEKVEQIQDTDALEAQDDLPILVTPKAILEVDGSNVEKIDEVILEVRAEKVAKVVVDAVSAQVFPAGNSLTVKEMSVALDKAKDRLVALVGPDSA